MKDPLSHGSLKQFLSFCKKNNIEFYGVMKCDDGAIVSTGSLGKAKKNIRVLEQFDAQDKLLPIPKLSASLPVVSCEMEEVLLNSKRIFQWLCSDDQNLGEVIINIFL